MFAKAIRKNRMLGGSEPQREAAETAIHLLEFRHIKSQRAESPPAKFLKNFRESGRHQDSVIDADAVGGIAFLN